MGSISDSGELKANEPKPKKSRKVEFVFDERSLSPINEGEREQLQERIDRRNEAMESEGFNIAEILSTTAIYKKDYVSGLESEIESLRERLAKVMQPACEYNQDALTPEQAVEQYQMLIAEMGVFANTLAERDELKHRLAKAEGERDEYESKYLVKLGMVEVGNVLREQLEASFKSLVKAEADQTGNYPTYCRMIDMLLEYQDKKWDAIRERDELSTRLLAAETAAAQMHGNADGYMKFVSEHSQWADETFATQTIDGVIAHLKREAQEIIDAQTVPDVISESVDVLMLAINLCHKTGFDFLKHVWRKFEINKARKWGKRDSEGVPMRERSVAVPVGGQTGEAG
jgi:hypothetical protein